MLRTTTAFAALAAFALAGAAQAQDFTPKAKGRIVLDVRVTQVAPQGDDPVTTLAGAASGLKAKVGKDVMPTIGVQYFLTDHVAVEVIAGTTKHTVRAQGPGVDIALTGAWTLNADIKKVFFETDAVDTKAGLKTKVTLDPVVASVGFGYRF